MITKIIKGKGFRGLASYVTREDAKARVIGADNLATEDPRQAARIMRQTANLSTRCKKPVLHFSLRPAPGDRVLRDDEFLQAGRQMLEAFGMNGHQALFVTHEAGTPGQHVHIVANRVDGKTGKAAALSNDRRIAKQVAAQLEKDFGLQVAVQERPRDKAGRDTDGERRERRRKARTGTDRHKEAAKNALASCDGSQARFEEEMHKRGFALAQGRKSGVILVDRSGKACKFSRALSKAEREALGISRQALLPLPAARQQLEQAAEKRPQTRVPAVPMIEKKKGFHKENKSKVSFQNENITPKQHQKIKQMRGMMRGVRAVARGLEID